MMSIFTECYSKPHLAIKFELYGSKDTLTLITVGVVLILLTSTHGYCSKTKKKLSNTHNNLVKLFWCVLIMLVSSHYIFTNFRSNQLQQTDQKPILFENLAW